MSEIQPPYLRSFGRRKSRKLRESKARLERDVLARYLIHPSEQEIRLADWFPGYMDYRLEIGFGDGVHLAYQAAQHKKTGFIGAEPFLNGVLALVEHAEREHLSNIRIYHDDVRPLLEALPPACLSRVDVLFPDPWPKARHKKRRLLQPLLLDLLARVLKPGAVLRLATDDADYAQWMLVLLTHDARFTWSARTPEDWKHPPQDWVETKYQLKALEEGRSATFLTFQRCA